MDSLYYDDACGSVVFGCSRGSGNPEASVCLQNVCYHVDKVALSLNRDPEKKTKNKNDILK